jgi:hypothetical protein
MPSSVEEIGMMPTTVTFKLRIRVKGMQLESRNPPAQVGITNTNTINIHGNNLKTRLSKDQLTAADLAVKAAPYLTALYQFFQSLP